MCAGAKIKRGTAKAKKELGWAAENKKRKD
jgi:hypothetical protein